MTYPALNRLVLYCKKMDDIAVFYETLFGYTRHEIDGDRIVELRPPAPGGAILMLHPAAKSQKQGQAQLKLVFDAPDIPAFCAHAEAAGWPFGAIHTADGYHFSNRKDPSGNSVQISSRAFSPAGGAP